MMGILGYHSIFTKEFTELICVAIVVCLCLCLCQSMSMSVCIRITLQVSHFPKMCLMIAPATSEKLPLSSLSSIFHLQSYQTHGLHWLMVSPPSPEKCKLIKHRNHHLKNIKVDSKQENFPINYTYVKPAIYWLVVSTSLKNISQWEGLSHILWKIENVPNHRPV